MDQQATTAIASGIWRLRIEVAMPVWLSAGLWGLLGASSLLVGAGLAYLLRLPRWLTAGIMSFGCGVLISAVAYDLLQDGFQEGGLTPIVIGAVAGSVAYALADWLVSRNGARNRKKSGAGDQTQASNGGGLAVAIGSLLDGVPESIVLGLGLVTGGSVSLAMLAAIFLSNLPEGLSSALGMKAAGRSKGYIFGLWSVIVILSAMASLAGAALFGGASHKIVAAVNAVAAGALLTMVVNTMVPEAVEGDQTLTGGSRGFRPPGRFRAFERGHGLKRRVCFGAHQHHLKAGRSDARHGVKATTACSDSGSRRRTMVASRKASAKIDQRSSAPPTWRGPAACEGATRATARRKARASAYAISMSSAAAARFGVSRISPFTQLEGVSTMPGLSGVSIQKICK